MAVISRHSQIYEEEEEEEEEEFKQESPQDCGTNDTPIRQQPNVM